jgi:error-prone DNA polymerase
MVIYPESDPDAFAELHCYSNFSFLKAASHPEELVRQAHQLKYKALAITDECSLAGVVRAWRECQQLNTSMKLIIGSSFHQDEHIHVALAPNKMAYHQLCRFITSCRRQADKGEYYFSLEEYLDQLTECIHLCKITGENGEDVLKLYLNKDIKPYLLLELSLSQQDVEHYHWSRYFSEQFGLDIVASNGANMHCSSRKMLLDTLTAIRLNKPIQQIANHLQVNGETYLKPLTKLKKIYDKNYLKNSFKVSEQCSFTLNEIKYQYPKDIIPRQHGASFYLRQQTWIGAHKRYPLGIPKKVKKTIKKEFSLIEELKYEYYFLTVYDIVQFAKRNNILHQGRGSAANSVVCYCLGITEVDPTKVNLLFERFINRRRNEPPDIDVDFDNSRREEVIQYLYNKYSRKRCAIAATVITYRPKSALRDVAKALNLDLVYLEKIIANYGWRYRSKNWIDDMVNQPGLLESEHIHVFKNLLNEILGFPRHLSQHVGGFILSEGPLEELVPIENATMEERTVIQWDKDDLETMTLMKIDVLALGMLSALQKCLDNISQYKGRPFQLQDIPQEDDPNVYDMLCKADTVGLFQVESRAQMNMLPRLKPNTFYDLVVQVAIVRPGPIHGDMVHPYLKRKHGKEDIHVPLKSMEPILRRTYGVPIFQEQVIAIAMMAADFSADEAEELRRSMASWKKRGHMDRFQQKLHSNLSKKGVDDQYIKQLQNQIEGFGEYGFPESHAASFALLAYYSAWMKHYYPEIFTAALLNSQPMGFYPPWQLIQDAKRHDVTILPIHINHSKWLHTADPKNRSIQLGFQLVKGFNRESAEAICRNRPETGYTSIQDVINRNTLEQIELDKLASSHCFKVFHNNRYKNLWQVQSHRLHTGLFAQLSPESNLEPETNRMDELLRDYESTGIMLNDHPMAYLRDLGRLQDCQTAEGIKALTQGTEIYVAGVITNRQRPKTSTGVTFVTLEDETGSVNLIIWLNTAIKQLKELSQAKCLKVYGKIDKDEEEQVTHFIAYKLFDISHELAEFKGRSRDYH